MTGSCSVTGLDVDTFVVTLKGANNYSAYLFEDINFITNRGAFVTFGVHYSDSNPAKLSHKSIFSFSSEIAAAPIPGVVLLFGSALLDMFGFSLCNKLKVARFAIKV